MKQVKNGNFASLALHILGLALCIAPPLICTLSYFPLWYHVSAEKALAGGALVLIILCALPIFKLLRKVFDSPSSYMIWLALFILFSLLSRIAHEMTVIAFVGFVSNLVGAICFAVAKRFKVKSDE